MTWVAAAIGSAFFAGIVSILAKCGIRHMDSDIATAIRTCVVLVFAWIVAAITVPNIPQAMTAISLKSYLFLVLSGLATGGSWICYFAALSKGDVNKVVPIDKSSTALAALLAVVLFGETGHLAVKLVTIAVILGGTFLMIEKKKPAAAKEAAANATVAGAAGGGDADAAARADGAIAPKASWQQSWLALAVLSAVFAALTSVLAKVGIEGVDSNLATAIRTCVVLVMAWAIVCGRGKLPQVRGIDKRELAFVCASGVATGASWLLYYYAIQAGQVSVVVQIDKLSILISIAFSRLVFDERLTRRSAGGLALIVLGTLAMTIWS